MARFTGRPVDPGGTRRRHLLPDEIVEARQDTVVVLHALTDHRRVLPIDKTGELLSAPSGFQLVISYNPAISGCSRTSSPVRGSGSWRWTWISRKRT